MDGESFSLLEELARMNPFLFTEHKFYTTSEGVTGFVYEEDDGAVRLLLADGGLYGLLKGVMSAGIRFSNTKQKINWKYNALMAIETINEAEDIINR